jgi:hypothetical protein
VRRAACKGLRRGGLNGPPPIRHRSAGFYRTSKKNDGRRSKGFGATIAPSMTKGATIPSCRSPTTRVIVFQWPWGTDPTNRFPPAGNGPDWCWWRSRRINAARLAHSHTIGSPRFNSAAKLSILYVSLLRNILVKF